MRQKVQESGSQSGNRLTGSGAGSASSALFLGGYRHPTFSAPPSAAAAPPTLPIRLPLSPHLPVLQIASMSLAQHPPWEDIPALFHSSNS